MVWIFAAIAVLLVFTAPRIRNIGFAILGAVFIAFLAIVVINRRPVSPPPGAALPPPAAAGADARKFDFDKYQQEKQDREDPQAATRIALSQVRFDQLQSIAGLEPGTLQTIRARLYNDSTQFTLTNYSYYLEVQDCLPLKPDDKHAIQCTTVFDQRASMAAAVPPGQARDVTIDIAKDPKTSAAPFKLLGTAHIELSPTSTRAYGTPLHD